MQNLLNSVLTTTGRSKKKRTLFRFLRTLFLVSFVSWFLFCSLVSCFLFCPKKFFLIGDPGIEPEAKRLCPHLSGFMRNMATFYVTITPIAVTSFNV